MDELINMLIGVASGVAFLAFVLTLVTTGYSKRSFGFLALCGAFAILFFTRF